MPHHDDRTGVFGEQAEHVYIGPERRTGERRSGADRRAMIRFEPDKEPRRSGRDRRRAVRSVWDGREGT